MPKRYCYWQSKFQTFGERAWSKRKEKKRKERKKKTESSLHSFNLADNNYGTHTCQDATTLDIFQETFEQNVKFK
jgi:hypothetical protein